jgi:hypothetical protein
MQSIPITVSGAGVKAATERAHETSIGRYMVSPFVPSSLTVSPLSHFIEYEKLRKSFNKLERTASQRPSTARTVTVTMPNVASFEEAIKFAPHVLFHENELCFPCFIEYILTTSILRKNSDAYFFKAFPLVQGLGAYSTDDYYIPINDSAFLGQPLGVRSLRYPLAARKYALAIVYADNRESDLLHLLVVARARGLCRDMLLHSLLTIALRPVAA